jgi:hypothetical protein
VLLPSLLLKISLHRSRPSCAALRHALAAAVFLVRVARLPHPALRSIHRCAPCIAVPHSIPCRARSSSLRAAPPLLRTVPRPPRARRGATRVLPTPAFPHQKVMAAVGTMGAVMRDLSKEML